LGETITSFNLDFGPREDFGRRGLGCNGFWFSIPEGPVEFRFKGSGFQFTPVISTDRRNTLS